MNQPPEIVYPPNANGPVFLDVLSESQTKVVVAAQDPENEIVTFFWNVPRATADLPLNYGQDNAGNWFSDTFIPREWLQDGDRIEVTASDQAQPRNLVTVQFTVRVLQ